MAKRRGNQDGTFYKRGNRWCGQIMIDNVRYTAYGKGIQECRENLRNKVKEGKKVGSNSDFIEYALSFVKFQYENKIIKETTYGVKKNIIKSHQDHFKGITVSKLALRDMEIFLASLKDSKLSKNTIISVMSVFLSVCAYAYEKGDMTNRIVVSQLKIDKPDEKNITLLSYDEAIVRINKIRNSRVKMLLKIIIHGGLRIGEAIALNWKDIDLDKGIIYVRSNMVYTNQNGTHLTTPKNNRVGQAVQLPSFFIDELKEYNQASEDGFLFKNKKRGFLNSDTVRRHMRKVFQGTHAEHGPHQLRHLYASHLLKKGVDLKTIQLQLRHHSIKTTDKYLHELEGEGRNVISELTF